MVLPTINVTKLPIKTYMADSQSIHGKIKITKDTENQEKMSKFAVYNEYI